jgi:hypothetical protein
VSDDLPPEPRIDWHGDGGGTSFFGCLVSAFGLIFMVTGGMCAFIGLTSSSIVAALVGLVFMAAGWKMMNR